MTDPTHPLPRGGTDLISLAAPSLDSLQGRVVTYFDT